MPSRVRGDTALLQHSACRFEDARDTYDPSKVNAVVLMADGRSVDVVKVPTDIRDVLLDAVIQRQCRPNC